MCIFDICVVVTDTSYYEGIHPKKILSQNERHEKGKYIGAFIERRNHFISLFFSVKVVMR